MTFFIHIILYLFTAVVWYNIGKKEQRKFSDKLLLELNNAELTIIDLRKFIGEMRLQVEAHNNELTELKKKITEDYKNTANEIKSILGRIKEYEQ